MVISDPSRLEPRTHLVVLYGGRSAEHEISCISAFHILRAVNLQRYQVQVIGITTGGVWVDATVAAVETLAGDATALPEPDVLVGRGDGPVAPTDAVVDASVGQTANLAGPDSLLGMIEGRSAGPQGAERAVVVFPVLHGPMGEDGTVQGLLEMAGLAYVGAGVAGSAAAMDKGLAKALFAAAGIPQARYLALRANEIDETLPKTVEAELGWPVFVKPANLGSTIGISRADGPAALSAAVELALRFDEYLVIEEEIQAREIEVGVLGDTELAVSIPGEVLPSHKFYDFEDKYLAGTARWQIPAELPPGVAEQIPDLARAACRALRVDGMARVDFFYEEATDRLLVNELNTIPGFTPISMYPQMWAASGVGYGELVDELVTLAIARHRRRAAFATARPS